MNKRLPASVCGFVAVELSTYLYFVPTMSICAQASCVSLNPEAGVAKLAS
jgi:hypothetical protein